MILDPHLVPPLASLPSLSKIEQISQNFEIFKHPEKALNKYLQNKGTRIGYNYYDFRVDSNFC